MMLEVSPIKIFIVNLLADKTAVPRQETTSCILDQANSALRRAKASVVTEAREEAYARIKNEDRLGCQNSPHLPQARLTEICLADSLCGIK
jgi:hypothetical protein